MNRILLTMYNTIIFDGGNSIFFGNWYTQLVGGPKNRETSSRTAAAGMGSSKRGILIAFVTNRMYI